MAERALHTIYYRIAAGAAYATEPIDLRTVEPVSLVMPAAWTMAAISFSGSSDGIAFGWLANSSARINRLNPATPLYLYQLSASWFNGVNWLHIVSGDLSLGFAGLVNQTADRVLTLNCRDRFAIPL